MPNIEALARWCAEHREELAQQLLKLELGNMRTGERRRFAMKNTSRETAERIRCWIAELNELLPHEKTRPRSLRWQ
jgi:hypothetical protein